MVGSSPRLCHLWLFVCLSVLSVCLSVRLVCFCCRRLKVMFKFLCDGSCFFILLFFKERPSVWCWLYVRRCFGCPNVYQVPCQTFNVRKGRRSTRARISGIYTGIVRACALSWPRGRIRHSRHTVTSSEVLGRITRHWGAVL